MTDFLDRVTLTPLGARDDSEQESAESNVLECTRCTRCTFIECQCEVVAALAPTDGGDHFPRSPLGATDALDALPTTRDEREALRARGEAVASVDEPDPHVPAGPRCRACGSIHGVWVRVHWKPGAVAGDKPCPEGFKP